MKRIVGGKNGYGIEQNKKRRQDEKTHMTEGVMWTVRAILQNASATYGIPVSNKLKCLESL
jgi:hypothetical protein